MLWDIYILLPDILGNQVPMYIQDQVPQSKYADLLAVIEELGKDIKPTYAGSRSASDRLKRGNR